MTKPGTMFTRHKVWAIKFIQVFSKLFVKHRADKKILVLSGSLEDTKKAARLAQRKWL
jgi:hypothetical protein